MDMSHVLFFIRSWDMGRLRSYYLKTSQYNLLENFLSDCKCNHADWMRGAGEPQSWEDRYSIDRAHCSENWLCMNVMCKFIKGTWNG